MSDPARKIKATSHKTGTREEWLAARMELLKAEKELTRRSDELARRRQELPWVPIDKEYRFETDDGGASLADLFRGRSQLLVYHFMFGPDYQAGCPSCSAIADDFKQREEGIEYNYRREPAWRGDGGDVAEFAAVAGTDAATYIRERPGMSAFALEDGIVYHTYSAYSRGLDVLWGMYQWLDRAPKGRNETGLWWRRHDEYGRK